MIFLQFGSSKGRYLHVTSCHVPIGQTEFTADHPQRVHRETGRLHPGEEHVRPLPGLGRGLWCLHQNDGRAQRPTLWTLRELQWWRIGWPHHQLRYAQWGSGSTYSVSRRRIQPGVASGGCCSPPGYGIVTMPLTGLCDSVKNRSAQLLKPGTMLTGTLHANWAWCLLGKTSVRLAIPCECNHVS